MVIGYWVIGIGVLGIVQRELLSGRMFFEKCSRVQ